MASTIPQPVRWQDLVYVSFTTLTSLGYGNVLPRNAAATSLAIAESIPGRARGRPHHRPPGRTAAGKRR